MRPARDSASRTDPRAIRIRTLGPGDRGRIEQAFTQLSRATVRSRFLGEVKLTARLFAWMDELDGRQQVALGASHAHTGEPLGLARFARYPDDPSRADVGVTVVDAWQGRGVGAALVRELARRAAAVGVTTFASTAYAENNAALALAGKLGQPRFGLPSGGVVDLEVEVARRRRARTKRRPGRWRRMSRSPRALSGIQA